MTVRSTSLQRAALATALVVAACGGSVATSAPVTEDPVPSDDGLPTFGLPSFDLGSFAIPSFSIPSFESDEELEALLPDEIGGQLVVKNSMRGESLLNSPLGGIGAIEPMLGELGASIEDFSVAIATAGPSITIFAYRIEGVAAERTFDGLEAALGAGGGGTVTETTVAGRSVAQVAAGGETTYVYLAGEVVFVIGGAVTPELLEDAVTQLPAA